MSKIRIEMDIPGEGSNVLNMDLDKFHKQCFINADYHKNSGDYHTQIESAVLGLVNDAMGTIKLKIAIDGDSVIDRTLKLV